MNTHKRLAFLTGLALITMTTTVMADITWRWSFASETGYFLTDGALLQDAAPEGVYEIADFCLISSATGGAIGSMSGGQYQSGAFSTTEPYTFSWDGSSIDQWLHSGINGFNWQTYGNTDFPLDFDSYFFGYASGNVNDATSAAHYVDAVELSVGTVTVEVADFDFQTCKEKPVSIPTLNGTGITILATMLALFGLYFRRFS